MKRFFVFIYQWMSMVARQFVGLLKKDYLLFLRRKKYLYLTLALPLFVSLIYIATINPSPVVLNVGACDFEQSEFSRELLRSVDGFSIDVLSEEGCEAILQQRIKEGTYIFGIVIPESFSSDIRVYKQAHVTAYFDNSDIALANYIDWKVNAALDRYERSIVEDIARDLKKNSAALDDSLDVALEIVPTSRSDRLSSQITVLRNDIRVIENMDEGFIVNPVVVQNTGVYEIKDSLTIGVTFIFPIITMFILFLLISTSVIFEKKINFFKRLRASPTSGFIYLLSKLVFFFGITVIQFVIVLLLFLIAGASLDIALGGIILSLLFIAFMDTLIGILIGLVSDSEGVAVLISLILSLPLMFMSGIFYPLQLLPKFMQWVSSLFPLTKQIFLMKKVLLFNQHISLGVFISVLVLFVVTYIYMRRK